MSTETVRVELGDRSYDIVIGDGVLEAAGERLARVLPGSQFAIVTDDNVAAIHLETLEASLTASGIKFTTFTVPAGEKTKSFEHATSVVSQILDARLERNDAIIALGGGVIGDLTGFAAAITRRGMHFVQIPTSLLAQVDSSVGGKTGINTEHGKNLVGAFYQPKTVLADTSVLDTLSPREFRAGYAEVAKYGLINQPDFFAWLKANWRDVFAGGSKRVEAIARSCQSKADVVARDELESGERALLNLGHTFGHALEGIAKYDANILVHGEGVSIGMVLAHAMSAHMNLASPDDTRQVTSHLKAVGLPTSLSFLKDHIENADQMMEFIAQDKKVSRGALTFILTRGIGKSFVAKDVPPDLVRSFLQDALDAA
ncbi:MAG: 3-dehydroquinate synthase [Pseudomonadota bacterium]